MQRNRYRENHSDSSLSQSLLGILIGVVALYIEFSIIKYFVTSDDKQDKETFNNNYSYSHSTTNSSYSTSNNYGKNNNYSTNTSNKYTKNYDSKDWNRYYEYHKYIGCTQEEVINSLGNDYYISTNKLVYTKGNITPGLTLSIRITFEFKNDKVYRITYYDQSTDHGMPTYIE